MFDANMRHLRKGRYFADVASCSSGSLYEIGVRHSMVVMFDKLDEDSDVSLITAYHDGKSIKVRCDARVSELWLVYAGNYDLTGFIDERSKALAKKIKEINYDNENYEIK